MNTEYGKNWDEFYKKTYFERKSKALWDVNSENSVQMDLPYFRKYFNNNLPVMDVGCGTGEQTAFLAKIYPKVIAVDAAKSAIEFATEHNVIDNVVWQVLDITNSEQCARIHSEFGDLNIYMRGVMHQIEMNEIDYMIGNLRDLMGISGKLYFVEVKDKIREYFKSLDNSFLSLPEQMLEVFVSNLPPRGLSTELINEYFNDSIFEILDKGDCTLRTNLKLPNGKPLEIPAVYGVIGTI